MDSTKDLAPSNTGRKKLGGNMTTLTLELLGTTENKEQGQAYEVIENETIKGLKFKGLVVSGALFSMSIFNNVTFENCDFFGSKFENCQFINCEFRNCNFEFSSLDYCKFQDCIFTETQWMGAKSLKTSFLGLSWGHGTAHFSQEGQSNIVENCKLHDLATEIIEDLEHFWGPEFKNIA